MTSPTMTHERTAMERLPKGAECQCMADGCGLFFSGESAFRKHWKRGGHVHPAEAGLVERTRVAGPVWGMPGENPLFGAD